MPHIQRYELEPACSNPRPCLVCRSTTSTRCVSLLKTMARLGQEASLQLIWLYERYNVPNAGGGMTKCGADHFGRDLGACLGPDSRLVRLAAKGGKRQPALVRIMRCARCSFCRTPSFTVTHNATLAEHPQNILNDKYASLSTPACFCIALVSTKLQPCHTLGSEALCVWN